MPDAENCGMYLTHCGVVRRSAKAKVRLGKTDTKPVTGMRFSYDPEKLNCAITAAKQMDGIYHVRVWLNEGELKPGMKVVVVEDLISTGGSSLKAVDAIRLNGCDVIGMVAAYTYGFEVAKRAFHEAKVPLVTLTNYEAVVEEALATGYIKETDVELLNEWRRDPAHWNA